MCWRGRGVYLSVVDREQFRREAQAVYEAVLPDAETRLLTWAWPRWIPLDDTARAQARFAWLEAELAKSKLPTLIIWGREDEVFDAETFAERFKRLMPHAEGPHMVTGRHFLQEDSGPEIARLIADFLDRLGGAVMADVAVIAKPATEGTRQALVLTEDRLGHYPEFRAFFVRTFDLDRVGLSEPGFVRAPSGLAYALVFVGPERRAVSVGARDLRDRRALEPLDDAVVDKDLWAILGWMIRAWARRGRWRTFTRPAGCIAFPRPDDRNRSE